MPVLSFLSRKESPSPVPSSGPSTPAPVFPGGPSPDVHVKHAPPSPASSVPSPKQHDNAPRFIEHVTEGTVDSSSSAIIAPTPLPALTQAPTPPPDATPVITTPTGLTKVDVPPQHPAVAGAGAGLGAPIEAHPDEDGRRQIAMPEPALALAPAPAPVPAPVSTASIGSSSAEPVPIVAPVPVHASPADDPTIVKPSDPVPDAPPGSKSILRNASVRSKHSRGASGARSASPTGKAIGVRTASPTNKAGSLKTAGTASGSTFANGAATVAPFVEPNVADALHERKATAEEELTDKDRAKISKEELKHNRRLSRVIKKEAQAESKALEVALRELTDLQKLQKSAIKDEGTTHAAHARALAAEHKAELAFIAARQAHEKVQAELRSAEEALEASRAHARETTEMLREKAEEVETLRLQKGTDDRERAVRVRELVGDDKKGIGRFFGL